MDDEDECEFECEFEGEYDEDSDYMFYVPRPLYITDEDLKRSRRHKIGPPGFTRKKAWIKKNKVKSKKESEEAEQAVKQAFLKEMGLNWR